MLGTFKKKQPINFAWAVLVHLKKYRTPRDIVKDIFNGKTMYWIVTWVVHQVRIF